MAENLGSGYVEVLPSLKGFLGPLVAEVKSSMSVASKEASASLTRGLKGGLTGLTSSITPAKVGLLALGAAAVKGIGSAIHTFEDAATEVRILERELGITAEQASKLRAAGNILGIDVSKLSVGFGIFSKRLVDGGTAFEKYGIQLADAEGHQKSMTDLLGEASDKFVALGPGVKGTALAMDLFGRSGKLLIPLLARGSDGIQELMDKADELGLVLSEKDVQAAKEAAIAQRELHLAFQGLSLQIGQAFLPVLEGVVKGLQVVASVFHAIPAPIRTVVVAVVALTGALTALGIAANVVRGGLAGLGLGLGATATEAVGTGAAEGALAVGGLGTALAELTPLLGAVGSAAFLGYAGFKIFGEHVDTLGLDLDKLKPNVRDAREAFMGGGFGADTMTDALARSSTQTDRQRAASRAAASETKRLADQEQRAATAAHAQWLASQQLAGGFLSVRGAAIQLHRDQATLNRLTDEGKTGTAAYKDAVTAVLGDQLAFTQSMKTLAKTMTDSGKGTDAVNGKIRFLAQQAGLSKGQIHALVSELDTYINKLHHVPKSVVTHVGVVGGPSKYKYKPLPGIQEGGRVTESGMALVGEAGPELLTLPAGASVVPLAGAPSPRSLAHSDKLYGDGPMDHHSIANAVRAGVRAGLNGARVQIGERAVGHIVTREQRRDRALRNA